MNLTLNIIILIFQLITVFLVIFLLFCINTMYCLISLAGIVVCTAIFLLWSNCEFFALVYLLIYIGAIVVFFLFTIMLLNLRFERVFDFDITNIWAIPCFLIFNTILSYFIVEDFSRLEQRHKNFKDVHSLLVREHIRTDGTYSPDFEKFALYHTNVDAVEHSANFKVIGFVMYQNYGYLCFLVGLILLMVMIGTMQVLKFIREEAALSKRLQ